MVFVVPDDVSLRPLDMLSLEDVNNILNNYPYYADNNIETYINNCIGSNNQKDNKYQYLVNAYKDTYNKYGDR